MSATSLSPGISIVPTTPFLTQVCAIFSITGANDTRKKQQQHLIYKLGTLHPHSLNEHLGPHLQTFSILCLIFYCALTCFVFSLHAGIPPYYRVCCCVQAQY